MPNDLDTIDATQWLPEDEDVLTEARKARGDITVSEGERGGIEHRSFENPLRFYYLKGYVSRPQYIAGNRLYSLWRRSILRTHYVRMNYGNVSNNLDLDAIAIAPRDYLNAIGSIRDLRQRGVVYEVCCEELYFSGLSGFSSERTARRRGLALLTEGLDNLAEYFKTLE